MEKDRPAIVISEDEEEWSPEEKKPIWRKIVVIIIIILLLLLLFWPISPAARKKQRLRVKKQTEGVAEGVVGTAKYTVISSSLIPSLGIDSAKAIPVAVWFEAQNLSSRPEILDHSMVKLKEISGREYVANPGLIEEWYERNSLASPWEEPIGPGKKIKAVAVFYAFRGPRKTFVLEGRDFEWVSNRSRDFLIGSFETFGPSRF